jgi:XTP/dITP diphosphohydrolase
VKTSIALATTNRGKLAEFHTLLRDLPVTIHLLDEVAPKITVVEDGKTFAENAIKKANAIARASMMLTLADDSGLEVDVLDGAPGVRSARYAHDRATDAENNAALLTALDALRSEDSDEPRSTAFLARFRCVLALVDPFSNDGAPRTVEGACEGSIVRTPRGSGGFGYDPLFVVDQTGTTMAELSEDEKNRVSHRGRAFAALLPVLRSVLAERARQTDRVG